MVNELVTFYVYDGVEVKKTGREAVKSIRSIEDRLVEVEPINKDIGWKKWVRPTDLYEIISQKVS